MLQEWTKNFLFYIPSSSINEANKWLRLVAPHHVLLQLVNANHEGNLFQEKKSHLTS